MRAKEEAFRILEAALSMASQGVDEAEVALGGGELGTTRYTHQGITVASEHSAETVSIRVAKGGTIVRYATSDLSHDGLREACESAKAQVAPFGAEGSPGFTFPEPHHYAEIDAYDPETEAIRGLERAAMAARGILAAKEHGLHARGQVLLTRGGMGFDGEQRLYAVANTRGLLAYHPETRIHCGVELSRPGGGTGAAAGESFSAEQLDPDRLVSEALQRASRPGTVQSLAAGRYVAVLEPPAVGALLRFIGLTCGAGLAEQGASFLSNGIGSRVAHQSVNIRDDFSHELHRGLPFDIEGVACQTVDLIRQGVAYGPVYTWENARRSSVRATGHHQANPIIGEYEGARYLVMDGDDSRSVEDLVEHVGQGVLVPDLSEVRLADSRTVRVMGVTRGLWRIEQGDIGPPAEPMRFDVEVLELLQAVTAASRSRLAQGSVVPGLAVDGFPLRPTSDF